MNSITIEKHIYLAPYKFFPVKEPLEFTIGFTERQNYVEVF